MRVTYRVRRVAYNRLILKADCLEEIFVMFHLFATDSKSAAEKNSCKQMLISVPLGVRAVIYKIHKQMKTVCLKTTA